MPSVKGGEGGGWDNEHAASFKARVGGGLRLHISIECSYRRENGIDTNLATIDLHMYVPLSPLVLEPAIYALPMVDWGGGPSAVFLNKASLLHVNSLNSHGLVTYPSKHTLTSSYLEGRLALKLRPFED
jgi:hypothetical protein